MEEEPLMIKGLFNDLTRTLFSSAICLDDLHLNLNPTSDVYDDWWLANEQLKRAIEFFLELRSTCLCYLSSIGSGHQENGHGHPIGSEDEELPPPMSLVNSSPEVLDGKKKSSPSTCLGSSLHSRRLASL